MERRKFIWTLASLVVGWIPVPPMLSPYLGLRRARAGSQLLRRVSEGDADQIVALMKSCVSSSDSFHGLCNVVEWTREWAEGVVRGRPRSLVIEQDDIIVAYCDVPGDAPRVFGNETIDHYRRAFWCGAAGVRVDVLGKERAVRVFQQILYGAFSEAMNLGYESVRAAAPWERHPYLPKAFKEFPGLTVQEFFDEEGATKYLLEWRLADAIQALAEEGADRRAY